LATSDPKRPDGTKADEGGEAAASSSSRLKSPIASGLLLLASTGIMILFAEFALGALEIYAPAPRFYPGEYQNRVSEYYVNDLDVGWRMKPNYRLERSFRGAQIVYASDDRGFRTHSERSSSDAPSRRIVMVGDSYIFGWHVSYEETVGGKVESSVADVIVENLGMPGFDVDQIWLTLRHWADRNSKGVPRSESPPVMTNPRWI
jgi:hypothetical protein